MKAHPNVLKSSIKILILNLMGYGLVFSLPLYAADLKLAYYYNHHVSSAKAKHLKAHSIRKPAALPKRHHRP